MSILNSFQQIKINKHVKSEMVFKSNCIVELKKYQKFYTQIQNIFEILTGIFKVVKHFKGS